MGSCRLGTQITIEIRQIRRESGHFKDMLSKIDVESPGLTMYIKHRLTNLKSKAFMKILSI